MEIHGAIFDQDGLLFDTEKVYERCWKRAGADFGLTVPDALTHACCGTGRDGLPAVIARFFPDLDAAAYIRRTFDLVIAEQSARAPDLKPGVRELLAECRARGIRTAVATSSIRSLTQHNLASTGLSESFDAVVTGGEVSRGKPAPDIFLLAAERLGVAPEACLVFEDSFSGIRAAHAAGCRPILIPDRLDPTPDVLALCRMWPTLADALRGGVLS